MAYGPDVAGRIAHATGTTAEFWLAREETFREGLAAGKKWSVS
jgi:plasmid maintenance system antidote protein VapI